MSNLPKIIAITGGIGSGKSVVSHLLRIMGYQVYDCDARAKWLMTHDEQLIDELKGLFGEKTYELTGDEVPKYRLNKTHLSAMIFGHPEALAQMNACVHPAVARDIYRTIKERSATGEAADKPFFFESAILFESEFNKLVPPDEVWTVSAPLELRIARAMQRDGATREKILARIHSQMSQEEKEIRADHIIYNDEQHSLISQVAEII